MFKIPNEAEHLSAATELCMHNILDFGHIFNKEIILEMLNNKLEEEPSPTPIIVLGLMHGIIDYYYSLLQSSTQVLTMYLPDLAGLGMLIEQEGVAVDIYNPDVDIVVELYTRFDFRNGLLVMQEVLNDIRTTSILKKYGDQLEEIERLMSPTLDYFLKKEVIEPFSKKKEEYFEKDLHFILFQHELMMDILNVPQILTLDEIKEEFLSRIKDMVVVNIEDIDLSAGQYKN